MVLHDLNQAVKYSDRITIMKNGANYKTDSSSNIFNGKVFSDVFNVEMQEAIGEINGYQYYMPEKLIKSE